VQRLASIGLAFWQMNQLEQVSVLQKTMTTCWVAGYSLRRDYDLSSSLRDPLIDLRVLGIFRRLTSTVDWKKW